MQIHELAQLPRLVKPAIDFFWKCWGNEANYHFYRDCIEHSLDSRSKLPKFYVGLDEERIIGSYALLTNDLISRQDLMPWLACLFVIEEERKKGYAKRLLDHGLAEAAQKGFDTLYLSTDLENFYERKGWKFLCEGYGVSGGIDKIYFMPTHPKRAISS